MDRPITEKCPHCGAGMKSFYHTLTPGLVNSLIKAIQFVHGAGKNRFHTQRDLKLSHNEAANFQKLRFHALVAHAEKNERSGYWLITARGGQFLRGEIAVPRRVKTFRNHITGHDIILTKISDFRGKVTEFEKDFAYEYSHPALALPKGLFG